MNICVFCSAYDVDKKYVTAAKDLARLIAKNGHHLVWGGSDTGIMRVMAEGVKEGGGKIYGVSVKHLRTLASKSADEMIIAKDMGVRKALMLARSDAVVMLPGGLGTLDEVTDVLELKKHKHHTKPIVALNTDNFYQGLKMQLDRIKAEGFIKVDMDKLIYFAKTSKEAMQFIENNAP
jgi:uncharacterized protein (TIGR00730 family)